MNRKENTGFQELWDALKVTFRGEVVALKYLHREEERLQSMTSVCTLKKQNKMSK